MSSSVSHPDPVLHDFGDSPEDERLRGLTQQQLADQPDLAVVVVA